MCPADINNNHNSLQYLTHLVSDTLLAPSFFPNLNPGRDSGNSTKPGWFSGWLPLVSCYISYLQYFARCKDLADFCYGRWGTL